MNHLRFSSILTCVVLLFTGGCGSTSPESAIADANKTNLQRLSNLYFTFQMKNQWNGPKDESEFKEFLRSYNPKKLARIGIDPAEIDSLFISSRDDKPFTIRYGVKGSAMGSSEPVVFETDGVNGMYRVGFLDMEQKDVNREEYDQLLNGEVAQPTRDYGRGDEVK